MILFGMVDRHTHHFGIVSSLVKKTKKFLTLILINVSLFHGEAPFVFAAALLQTAAELYHRNLPDGSLDWGASPSVQKNGVAGYLLATGIIYNDHPSYRVGQASELRPSGSLACPTSISRNSTSYRRLYERTLVDPRRIGLSRR
jgi:hypothetical protein